MRRQFKICTLFMFIGKAVFAYDGVAVSAATAVDFAGPAHHGIAVEMTALTSPNLSAYEVQIKQDSGNPYYPPYRVYNSELIPADVAMLEIPYRNGILVLQSGQKYCVRVRAVYGATATAWSEVCDITVNPSSAGSTDADADGLTEAQEFAQGTDPNNADSDSDGTSDGDEVDLGTNPNGYLFPALAVRAPNLDFGTADYSGLSPTQHQYLEIENTGDELALIDSIVLTEDDGDDAVTSFYMGTYATSLGYVPPDNIMRVPISFLPRSRGTHTATLEITSSNNTATLPEITLTGNGTGFPSCLITPDILDFGAVDINNQDVAVQYVTFSNKSEEDAMSDAYWNFTLTTTNNQMAPGIRVYTLAPEEEIEIPVFYRHSELGTHDNQLTVTSMACGEQVVTLKGTTQ